MEAGVLYFIAAGNEVVALKIGFTDDGTAKSRLQALQTGNHLPLHIVALGPGTLQDEDKLHWKHRYDNIRGEWFNPSTAVLISAAELGLTPIGFEICADLQHDFLLEEAEKVESLLEQKLKTEVERKVRIRARERIIPSRIETEEKIQARIKWAREHPEEWAEFSSSANPKSRRLGKNEEYWDTVINTVNENL